MSAVPNAGYERAPPRPSGSELLEVARFPGLVEEWLGWAVEPEQHEPSLAWNGPTPIRCRDTFRQFGAEVEIDRPVLVVFNFVFVLLAVVAGKRLAGLELGIGLDPLRRLAGATPSYAGGILVCPTAAGAVVAWGADMDSRGEDLEQTPVVEVATRQCGRVARLDEVQCRH
mgnify:CR=1 FL=1